MNKSFHFPHHPNNSLLHLLYEPVFASALSYLVTFKNHYNLVVKPHANSIELSNVDVKIFIVIYSGFEIEEYITLKNQNNVHLVCLDFVSLELIEFANLPLKKVDKLAWMFAIMEKSECAFVQKLNTLKTLRID